MRFDAGQLVDVENHEMIRELVLETLVSLLDDPVAKVVDGPMRYTFSDPDELRRPLRVDVAARQEEPAARRRIFWVVGRDDDPGQRRQAPRSELRATA